MGVDIMHVVPGEVILADSLGAKEVKKMVT